MISRRSITRLLLAAGAWPLLGMAGPTPPKTKAEINALAPNAFGYSIYRFGWRPNLPGRAPFQAQILGLAPPPVSVDLRPQMPDVYDQHQVGSCTSNALAACIQYVLRKDNGLDYRPSRLFIYYLGRKIENAIPTDAGLSIDDAIKVVEAYGVPSEADWPYDGTPPDDKGKFPDTSRAVAPPRPNIMNKALLHRTTIAFSLPPAPNLAHLKDCLAHGYPFLFGFTIYKSFFNNNDEPPSTLVHIPVPPDADQPIGGHAVVAVGYKDDNAVQGGGYFICRNSWGLTDTSDRPVHDKGHFYMPYAYTQEVQGAGPSLASDFYTVRQVS